METFLIKDLIWTGLEIVAGSFRWMGWNLFLAVIPLYLSIYLFRADAPGTRSLRRQIHQHIPSHIRHSLWGIMILVFIAFLPNAPYILTDVIHLNRYILEYDSRWVTGFIIAPLFAIFITTRFLAYVLSLINVGHFLHRQGKGRWIVSVELLLHCLSAIGVFVGRFPRLNSWHLATQPWRVLVTMIETLLSPAGILGILVGFGIITGLYIPTKAIVLALINDRKKRSISVI